MRNNSDTDQNPSLKQLSFIPEYNGHTLFHNKKEPQNKTSTFQQSKGMVNMITSFSFWIIKPEQQPPSCGLSLRSPAQLSGQYVQMKENAPSLHFVWLSHKTMQQNPTGWSWYALLFWFAKPVPAIQN